MKKIGSILLILVSVIALLILVWVIVLVSRTAQQVHKVTSRWQSPRRKHGRTKIKSRSLHRMRARQHLLRMARHMEQHHASLEKLRNSVDDDVKNTIQELATQIINLGKSVEAVEPATLNNIITKLEKLESDVGRLNDNNSNPEGVDMDDMIKKINEVKQEISKSIDEMSQSNLDTAGKFEEHKKLVEERLNEHTRQNEMLFVKIHTWVNEINEIMKTRISQVDLQELEDQLGRVRQEITRAQLDKHMEEEDRKLLKEFAISMDQVKQEVHKLRSHADENDKRINDFSKDLKRHEDNIDAVNETNSKHKDALQSLKARLGELNVSLEQKANETELLEKINEVAVVANNTRTMIKGKAHETDVQNIQDTVAALQEFVHSNLKSVADAINDIQVDVLELKTNTKTENSRASNLEIQMSEFKKYLELAESKLSQDATSKNDQILDLQNNLAILSDIVDRKADHSDVMSKLTEVGKQTQDAMHVATGPIQKELADLNSVVKNMERSMAQNETQLTEITSQFQEQLDQLRNLMSDKNEEIEMIEQIVQSLQGINLTDRKEELQMQLQESAEALRAEMLERQQNGQSETNEALGNILGRIEMLETRLDNLPSNSLIELKNDDPMENDVKDFYQDDDIHDFKNAQVFNISGSTNAQNTVSASSRRRTQSTNADATSSVPKPIIKVAQTGDTFQNTPLPKPVIDNLQTCVKLWLNTRPKTNTQVTDEIEKLRHQVNSKQENMSDLLQLIQLMKTHKILTTLHEGLLLKHGITQFSDLDIHNGELFMLKEQLKLVQPDPDTTNKLVALALLGDLVDKDENLKQNNEYYKKIKDKMSTKNARWWFKAIVTSLINNQTEQAHKLIEMAFDT